MSEGGDALKSGCGGGGGGGDGEDKKSAKGFDFVSKISLTDEGLRACLKLRTSPDGREQMYECAWAPFSESKEPIQWVNLAKCQVTFPNMLLHDLNEEDSMSFLVSTVESMPSTRALMLINTGNALDIDERFHPKGEGPSVPTLAVTKATGDALHKLIEDYGRNVEVKVENMQLSESQVVEEDKMEAENEREHDSHSENIGAAEAQTQSAEVEEDKKEAEIKREEDSHFENLGAGEAQTQSAEVVEEDKMEAESEREDSHSEDLGTGVTKIQNTEVEEDKKEAEIKREEDSHFENLGAGEAAQTQSTEVEEDKKEAEIKREQDSHSENLGAGEAQTQSAEVAEEDGMEAVRQPEDSHSENLGAAEQQTQSTEVEEDKKEAEIKREQDSHSENLGAGEAQTQSAEVAEEEEAESQPANSHSENLCAAEPQTQSAEVKMKAEHEREDSHSENLGTAEAQTQSSRDDVTIKEEMMTIPKGLKIKIKGVKEVEEFPAVWVKHTMPPETIQWTEVFNEPRSYKHIRCIDMEYDNLAHFVAYPREKLITALIIVCVDDECSIHKYDSENEELEYPTVMVPKSVGKILKRGFDQFKEVKVGIKVSSGDEIIVSDGSDTEESPIVENGLHIRLHPEKTFFCLSYKWISYNRGNLEWTKICMVSQQSPHILCVHLECPIVPAKQNTKAVLLINRSNLFDIERTILTPMETHFRGIPIIVTNVMGQKVWDILNDGHDIEGKVFVQVPLLEGNEHYQLTQFPTAISSKTEQGSWWSRITRSTRILHPAVSSLTEKIHKLLYGPDGFSIASEDSNLFKLVMQHFYQFEEKGLQLMDELDSITVARSWHDESYEKMWKSWFIMLLDLLKFGSDQYPQDIIPILFDPVHRVAKMFNSFLSKQIIDAIQSNIKKITAEQLSELHTRCGDIIPPKIIELYLKNLHIDRRMKITDQMWQKLLKGITILNPYARGQLVLVGFFEKAGREYEKNHSDNFICHVLQLNVPDLFAVEKDTSGRPIKEDQDVVKTFCDVLESHSSMKRQPLLEQLDHILDTVPNEHYQFHGTVLKKIRETILQETKKAALSQNTRTVFFNAIDKVQRRLNITLERTKDWRNISLVSAFCFQFLSGCFEKISIVENSLDVIEKYYPAIDLLSRPCQLYVQQHRNENDFPDDIPAAEDSVVNYFGFVKRVYQVLFSWKTKFVDQLVTYSEICLYSLKLGVINKVAKAIGIPSLAYIDVHRIKELYNEQFQELNKLLIHVDKNGSWCSLFSLLNGCGVDLPNTWGSLVSKVFLFPDSLAGHESPTFTPMSDTRGNIKLPIGNNHLHMKEDVHLAVLSQMVFEIKHFIKPLEPVMSMLIFFKCNKSVLFDHFLERELTNTVHEEKEKRDSDEQVVQLSCALHKTECFLRSVMEGTVTYGNICGNIIIDLGQIKVEEEFRLFSSCSQLSGYRREGLEAMKSMLKLLKSIHIIRKIAQVCEQYELDGCIKDPKLKYLTELANSLESEDSKMKLTPAKAQHTWEEVYPILCLDKNSDLDSLSIFKTVSNSVDFYHFIVEMNFRGKNGENLFRQQHELVTAELEHDAFTDSILNNLFGAFFFLAPFMDRAQNLNGLMKQIVNQEMANGQEQLEMVKCNMQLIRLWFSRVQEGLVENVSNDLRSVWKSGKYSFSVPANPGKQCHLKLSFDHYRKIENEKEQKCEWEPDQINDFVQKLGFLQDKEDMTKVEHFRLVTKATNELFDIIVKLRYLGYPNCAEISPGGDILCTMKVEAAMDMVHSANTKYNSWMKNVEDLLNECKWLLFFTIPKLLLIHSLLEDGKMARRNLMLEFYYIFKRNQETWKTVDEATEMAVKKARTPVSEQTQRDVITSELSTSVFKSISRSSSSISAVGSFLNDIFESKPCLEAEGLAQRYQWNVRAQYLESDLLVAKNYTQSQLIHLIISVYNGIPEHFEILRCQSTTTEHDLRRFMKRVLLLPRLYIIVEVNVLSFDLQEVLFQIILTNNQKMKQMQMSQVYFVETAPSMLQQIPWLQSLNCEENDITKEKAEIQEIIHTTQDFSNSRINLVYGAAGDGKTHYIRKCLRNFPEDHVVTISINESFTIVDALQQMSALNRDGHPCSLFFNFTLLPAKSESSSESDSYKKMLTDIGWFFFDLLLLGYVEDHRNGISFCISNDSELEIYIEVPSRDRQSNPKEDLESFLGDIPVLELVGKTVFIDTSVKYSDEKVQLVCKYLKAYKEERIDKLCRGSVKEVKFSTDRDIDDDECSSLLSKYMPHHVKQRKVTQRMFVHYMWRRCEFLEKFPGFVYNTGYGEYLDKKTVTNTTKLGSTLLEIMLEEVSIFCNPDIKGSWGQRPHQQLIYDFSGGGGSIGLVSLLSDKIDHDKQRKFTQFGIKIPSPRELHNREILDGYLARALGIKIDKRLKEIDDRKYVLTIDYALKMLDIHERYQCGIPVVIEGETGVGKTALLDMLSTLWNRPWIDEWEYSKSCIMDKITKEVTVIVDSLETSEQTQLMNALHSIASGNQSVEAFKIVGNVTTKTGKKLFSELQTQIQSMKGDTIFTMLCYDEVTKNRKLNSLFENAHFSCEDTAELLFITFTATIKSVFHKLNVHAALQPKDVEQFFKPVFEQAKEFDMMYKKCRPAQHKELHVPYVIVYLDEINTASCLGLFKEIITDKTLNGNTIPSNIFVIAACNPHRGQSLAALGRKHFVDGSEDMSWLTGTYNVRELHPTLQYLMWDYGSLNSVQEDEYISEKLRMINHEMSDEQVNKLSHLISSSQDNMRKYAEDNLLKLAMPPDHAKQCAKSSVSQRDIQRVFNFYQWLMKSFKIKARISELSGQNLHNRAMSLSLGLVYFMRLSLEYREKYQIFLDDLGLKFSETFEDELQWLIKHVELPSGIAKTKALKENLFAVIACTATHTPLIIVGDPGSSKTLSFNVAISNVQGKESRNEVFRNIDVYHSLHPHFYQCSRRTTSIEIDKVFKRAISRQRSLAKVPLPVYCVVFMDEAGLPEQKLESLKVLHYYLDDQQVSFVAISNHVLDASKTNRAVSLFRPRVQKDDLKELASESIVSLRKTKLTPNENLKIEQLCSAFRKVMIDKQFRQVYGLRDFIHFVRYLRRHRMHSLDGRLILEALERNFNGSKRFYELCTLFFDELQMSKEKLNHRNTLEIIRSSTNDHCIECTDDIHSSVQIESRYKLIIDPSEDESLVRLLFSYDILPVSTRVYICSDFPSDHHSQVTTIQKIIHSVAAGHTVLLCQTDQIHESFYDLFNQRFRLIKNPKSEQEPKSENDQTSECERKSESNTQYFTNIAIGAHSKPCRVDPNFQCFIVIDETELQHCPTPFLNRFEKYYLDHKSLFQFQLQELPPCLRILIERAYTQVESFVKTFQNTKSSIYGLCKETLESLFLTVLPTRGYTYKPLTEIKWDEGMKPPVFLLHVIQIALKNHAGFRIPVCTDSEKQDAEHIFHMISCSNDSEFQRILDQIDLNNIVSIVDEAFHWLYNGPHPTDTKATMEMYTDACVVITFLLQWLVMHLSKRLMQLLSPEALVIHNQEIPRHYSKYYMKSQEHFHFQRMVRLQLDRLENNEWDRAVSASKLICFTRSSALIHHCPKEHFPIILQETQSTRNVKDSHDVLTHIWDKEDSLMLLKLSRAHSQEILQTHIKTFLDSHCEVFVIIINSQQIHKRMINHLRIMIEEEERRNITSKQMECACKKLFVLLLHFPAHEYYNQVYPALFLQGWDHHYLDSIASVKLTAYGFKEKVVDIELWFQLTCLPSEPQSENAILNDRLNQLLLKEAIPVVASKIDNPSSELFSMTVDASRKTQYLKALFCGDKKMIGEILLRKFCRLWNPARMAEYIDSAANTGYSTKSTLNIIETVETTFRYLFFDFLVYMLSHINAGFNIDLLFTLQTHHSRPVVNLFCQIVEVFPCPPLYLLPTHCSNLKTQLEHSGSKRLFPFFNEVSKVVEDVVEMYKESGLNEDMQKEYDITTSIKLDVQSKLVTMKQLAKEITKLLSTITSECHLGRPTELTNELYGVSSDEHKEDSVDIQPKGKDQQRTKELAKTFGDASNDEHEIDSSKKHQQGNYDHEKKKRRQLLKSLMGLRNMDLLIAVMIALKSEEQKEILWDLYSRDFISSRFHIDDFQFGKDLLRTFFAGLDNPDIITRLVSLHAQTDVNPIDMSHLFEMLKHPLLTMHKTLGSPISQIYSPSLPSLTDKSMTLSSHMAFIIENLFETLSNAALKDSGALFNWHGCYREIVSHPSVEDLFTSVTQDIEAKLNIMQATHLMLQTSQESNAGLKFFLFLKDPDFPPRLGSCSHSFPRLKEMAYAGEVISEQLQLHPNVFEKYFEGLIEFFFLNSRSTYNPNDCETFLEFLNGFGTLGSSKTIFRLENISLLKYYLLQVLTHDKEDSKSGMIIHFSTLKQRQLVGSVILQKMQLMPGPYIPLFYQMQETLSNAPVEAAQNQVMQQSLCHLYFLAVLEHLQEKQHQLSHLNSLTSKIDDAISKEMNAQEKILLNIEKQALLQAMIHQVASHFDYKNPSLVHKLYSKRLTGDTNRHFCDESTGGSAKRISGHGLVSALHIQTYLSSSRLMLHRLKDCKSTLVETVKCIQPLQHLQCATNVDNDAIPFLGLDTKKNPVGQYYVKIRTTLEKIAKSDGGKKSVDSLIEIAKESMETTEQFNLSECFEGLHIGKKHLFRMLIWLATYYTFSTAKKNYSRSLSDVFGQTLSRILDPDFTALLQCFAYPPCMIEEPERNIFNGTECDPIFDLFNLISSSEDHIDAVAEYVRDTLAYLVAAIVACPSHKNHLWFHLYRPEELENTLMTGFLLESPVYAGKYYDSGVCLTDDGLPSKPEYIVRMSNATLSVHSLHLLLWANFGAFSISLLTRPGSTEQISGTLISKDLPIRHYCLDNVIKMWNCMHKALHLSAEELTFFIKRCMLRLIDVSTENCGSPQLLQRGIFPAHYQEVKKDVVDSKSIELDQYERVWHQKIFIPCKEFFRREYENSYQHRNASLLTELRYLERSYPYFPSHSEFTHDLLLKVSIDMHNPENELYVLTQFALEYERLYIIGLLLPDLIEFYQWIHTELIRHRVQWKYADTHTVESVVIQIDERNEDRGILKLYERVTENYNKYLDAVGGNIYTERGRKDGKVHKITPATKLLSLLSTTTLEDEEQHDHLFLIIADMVQFHNEFLEKVCNAAQAIKVESLKCPVPDQEALKENVITPKQVSTLDCIIPWKKNSRLHHIHLFRKRWMQPNLIPPVHSNTELECSFNFHQLQIDIVNEFILKKPRIDDPRKNLRVKFFFQKKLSPETDLTPLTMESVTADVKEKSGLWLELDAANIKELECEYHSAEYQKLMEVTTALSTVSGYLKKYKDAKDHPEIAELTLPEFLLKEYRQQESEKEETMTEEDVLKEVGFNKECSLSKNQIRLLKELKIKHVHSMWKLFIGWIKDCVYNFHHLPIVMKVHLSEEDMDTLQKLAIAKECDGPPQTLLQELTLLEETLLQNEQYLRSDIIQNGQKPIKVYMKKVRQLDQMDQIFKHIPKTVQCQHYVHLRIVINRVKSQLQTNIEITKHEWTDFVEDLWDHQHLKHLRDAATPYVELVPGFIFDPYTGKYGFQAWETTEEDAPLESDSEPPLLKEISVQQNNRQMSMQPATNSMKDKASSLTAEDVGEFLKEIKMEDYVELFVSNGIDGETLFAFDATDLEDLGVCKKFQRTKIITKFSTFLETK